MKLAAIGMITEVVFIKFKAIKALLGILVQTNVVAAKGMRGLAFIGIVCLNMRIHPVSLLHLYIECSSLMMVTI